MAIDESANLAKTRGSYKNFQGSGWSKGMVPIDTLALLDEQRGGRLTVTKESKHKGLDWNILREKVRHGMRNATLMAVAPNATIGLVARTVPGIDPRFAQVFSRNTLSGKYLDINHNLVKDLTNLGIWEEVKGQIVEFVRISPAKLNAFESGKNSASGRQMIRSYGHVFGTRYLSKGRQDTAVIINILSGNQVIPQILRIIHEVQKIGHIDRILGFNNLHGVFINDRIVEGRAAVGQTLHFFHIYLTVMNNIIQIIFLELIEKIFN
jgi:hypothetical protein